jgi:hypothetical protein
MRWANSQLLHVWTPPKFFLNICQVAAQQGYYLADCFNKMDHCKEHPEGPLRLSGSGGDHHNFRPFRYFAFLVTVTCSHPHTCVLGTSGTSNLPWHNSTDFMITISVSTCLDKTDMYIKRFNECGIILIIERSNYGCNFSFSYTQYLIILKLSLWWPKTVTFLVMILTYCLHGYL